MIDWNALYEALAVLRSHSDAELARLTLRAQQLDAANYVLAKDVAAVNRLDDSHSETVLANEGVQVHAALAEWEEVIAMTRAKVTEITRIQAPAKDTSAAREFVAAMAKKLRNGQRMFSTSDIGLVTGWPVQRVRLLEGGYSSSFPRTVKRR